MPCIIACVPLSQAFKSSLSGTIAKRQNSLLQSLEETVGASAQRPGTAPGGAGAGAKKQRAMSPDLFGTDKPPPRPRTADGRKVSISDVVEEYDDKVIAHDWASLVLSHMTAHVPCLIVYFMALLMTFRFIWRSPLECWCVSLQCFGIVVRRK
jgi:hypothetical protein